MRKRVIVLVVLAGVLVLYGVNFASNRYSSVIVVYPIFTTSAYNHHAFYAYHSHTCDESCLTAPIVDRPTYNSSANGAMVMAYLGYKMITDVDVDKDPMLISKYHTVVVLHSEYVTRHEFDAITQHHNVIYLYPNSLYAEVKTNYTTNTVTLVRGHNYPHANITNGFRWQFDNSNLEYNTECNNWQLYAIPNGKMLNCYPEYRILYDPSLIMALNNLH